MGSVRVFSGLYPQDTLFSLTATPVEGCRVLWTSGGATIGRANTLSFSLTQDTLITAYFTDTFSIAYELNGGVNDTLNPATYTKKSETITLQNPTRTGYTFTRWRNSGDAEVTVIGKGSTGDTTLWAEWKVDTFRITYELNGGVNDGSNPGAYTVEDSITLQNPTRTGYNFTRWRNSDSTTVDTIKKGSTGDMTLYAEWNNVSVTVSPTSATVKMGTTQKFTATVIVIGTADTTVAWSVAGNSSTGTTIGADGVLTVGANETADTLTVTVTSTFDATKWGTATVIPSGVTGVTVTPNPATVKKGTTQPFTATVTVKGNADTTVTWSVVGGAAGTTISADGVLTVGANETADTLTVTATSTFDATKWDTATVTVAANAAPPIVTKVTVSPNPVTVQKGTAQTFVATVDVTGNAAQTVTWSLMGGVAGTAITQSGVLTVAADETATMLIVMATSTADPDKFDTATVTVGYTITFNAQGGTVSPTSKRVTYGTSIDSLPVPTYTGYTFDGWYTAQSGGVQWTKDTVYRIAHNTTLYAKWTAREYIIWFNANAEGIVVSPDSMFVTYGAEIGRLPVPVRPGYNFMGWYTDVAGGVQYTDTSVYRIAGAKMLYAHWPLTVAFNSNGGSPVDSQRVAYGGTVTPPPAPIKAGSIFGGWYRDRQLSVLWDFSTNVVESDVTLYARWLDENQTVCTVTFNSADGSYIPPQTVAVGDKATRPADPTKADSIFGGWYRDRQLSVLWDFSTNVVESDVTLYARWLDENQPIVRFVSNGGSPVDPQRVAEGGTVKRPPNPTLDYYSFGDWYEDPAFSYPWNFNRKVYENVTVYAKWIPFDIEQAMVVINGKVLSPIDDVITYEVPCGDTATLRVSLDTIPGNTALIPVNRPYPPDTAITLTSLGGQAKEYTLRVEKPFVFSDIVRTQLGGGLLMVIRNPENNGGFDLQAVWWWQKVNGDWGPTGNSKFYHIFPSGKVPPDSMRVIFQDATGALLSTCPDAIDTFGTQGKVAREAVYPNPVSSGGTVRLKENVLTGDELQELGELQDRYATFRLFDVQGRLVREGKTSELHQGLTMPATPGIYYILLDGKAGKLQLKVAVGQ
jgi:uncharacterized repeat protein (TIGR02543 family)